MLKKVLVLLLILVLCLSLGACKKNDVQQPSNDDSSESIVNSGSSESNDNSESTDNSESVNNSESTDNSETTENSESTENTENTGSSENTETEKQLAVSDWQTEVPNYLSYEEYFSVEREFGVDLWQSNPKSWIKGNYVYELDYDQPINGKCLVVRCRETDDVYIVPNSDAYAKYYIAGADGHYGYLYRNNQQYGYDQFLRMDLVTGNAEILLEGGVEFPFGAVFGNWNMYLLDNLVLYYSSYIDNELIIGRLYLPTLNNEILYKTQGEFYGIRLGQPETNKTVVWEVWNPEYVDYLKAELANPDSKIQKGDYYDYSEIWKREDALTYILHSPMHIDDLENAGNQYAQLKCIYDIESGKLTQQVGIMDNCYYGSGYPHDHYNFGVTTAPAPEVIMGDWTKVGQEIPFPLCQPANDGTAIGKIQKATGVDSQIYLYAKTDGAYKKIAESPIKIVADTGTCAIYVTADGKSVVAGTYDGTQIVELYRAAHGGITESKLSYEKNTLVILDADTLVEIDLYVGRYRELVKHQHIIFYYTETGYKDGREFDEDAVYFVTSVGLYYDAFIIDLKTGELKDVSYRL